MPSSWSGGRRLFAVDLLAIAFVAALGALCLTRASQIPGWTTVAITCGVVLGGVPSVAWLRARLNLRAIRVLHDWLFPILIVWVYRAVLVVARPSHAGRVFDDWMIAADRWLFGTDPTVWLSGIAHPAATEVLQIAYWMFYLMPFAVALELYLDGREWRFRQWIFVSACGFLVSYVGYLSLPCVGPRFTLHELSATARELPGLWLTPYLRAFIDGAGMVPIGSPAGEALRLAPRDAFPSGHTLVTLLVIAWSWRCRMRVRWPVTVIGSLLVVATVYLRYHYVVDVAAGAILAVACYSFAPALHGRLSRAFGTLDGQAGRART
jgi:membrane-associated phospholipid phosphatase